MSGRVILKTGDVFLLPLSSNKSAIAQLVYYNTAQGAPFNPLIQVVKGEYPTNDIDLDNIDLTKKLFPPVCTGIRAAVRTGLWKRIGNKPVINFIYPKFVGTNYLSDGKARGWWVSDDNGSVYLGESLPEEYKVLEYQVVLSPQAVIDRIITGKLTFPYGELIENNYFIPQSLPRSYSKEEKDRFAKDVLNGGQ